MFCSELNLAVATCMSDRLIDNMLDSLDESHKKLVSIFSSLQCAGVFLNRHVCFRVTAGLSLALVHKHLKMNIWACRIWKPLLHVQIPEDQILFSLTSLSMIVSQ